MAFDLASAKPVGGFDMSTAKPVTPQVGNADRASSQGLLRQFAHGASFGFDDELAGAASALTGGDYESARRDYLAERNQYGQDHPAASFAANLAGGLATGVGGAAKLAATKAGGAVAEAVSTLPRWAQLATAGGAAGAVQGAGDADTGSRTWGAVKGGVAGAVAGAVLPPVIGVVGKVADKLVGAPIRWGVNALRTPEEQGLRALYKALQRDEITPAEFSDRLKALGPNAVAADAGGENVLGLAKAAVRRPGTAKNAGMAFQVERAQGAGARVNGALQQAMGVESTATDDIVQGLHQNMRNIAAEHGYDDILNSGSVEYTPELEKLMTGPTMQEAMGAAKRMIKNDIARGKADKSLDEFFKETPAGIEFAPIPETERAILTGRRVPQSGRQPMTYEISASREAKLGPARALSDPNETVGEVATRPTLRAWDYVKRGLDRIIGEETDPITGKLSPKGAEAVDFKSQMMPHVDKGNDAYVAVRSAYADEKAGESALNLGRKFMRDDFDVTNRRLADMTPAERQYFKVGAARAAQDMIEAGKRTGMRYADFLETPGLTKKLRAAFAGDEEGFMSFMGQLENEARMGRTFNKLRGGSDSIENINNDAELGGGLANGIPVSKEGLARKLGLMLTEPNAEVSGQLQRLLLTNDAPTKAQIQERLMKLAPSLNRRVLPSYAAPAAVGAMGQQLGQRVN
jgi:hypothetical protein